MNPDYDAIIVGGRVAGSTLAARLGRYGLRVLLLERGEFPSLPAVSCPIIYSPTMKLLDEIGADETAYARNTPKIHHMVTIADTYMSKVLIPAAHGRDYAYAVDRARFDSALWETALQYPTVEGRQNFAVTDVLVEDGQAVGIMGKPKNGETERITARLVIGADGRFGIVARKMQAEDRDKIETQPTSIYYAYWRDVVPLDEQGASAAAYDAPGRYGYLVMDSADGQTVVAVEGRSDEIDPAGTDIETFYTRLLRRNPKVWARLNAAERITTVRGMRNIGNCYRQPGGAGWALVGDAYFQKDPLDGQGIYDAVITSKILAQKIRRWFKNELTWDEVLAKYDEESRIKTYGTYRMLQTRIRSTFYSDVPLPEPLARWLAQDDQIKDLLGKTLTRQLPADLVALIGYPVALGAIARGGMKEIQQKLRAKLQF